MGDEGVNASVDIGASIKLVRHRATASGFRGWFWVIIAVSWCTGCDICNDGMVR